MKKRVLILTWSYGAWHNTAAENLKRHYERLWYDAKIVDIIEHLNKLWWKSSKKIYQITSEEYPKIWQTFFEWTDYKIISRIFYGIRDPIWQAKFDNLIEDRDPDHVISVFPFWNGRAKNHIKNKKHRFKWWIVITDAINIQSFWYLRAKYVDRYYVFDDYTRTSFSEKFEISKEKIKTSFFPILKEDFTDKSEIWNKKILILLTWLKEDFIEDLLKELEWFEVTVLKWRNDVLFHRLKKEYNFKFIEFIDILRNLKNYDIMVGKPWWAISCECIATDTPLLVPSFFPWQERWNVELLEISWTWVYEPNPKKMAFLIKYIDWSKLLINFKKVKKSDSCEIIEKDLSSMEN